MEDVPIAWGTLNIACIGSKKPILKRHIDAQDLLLGFSLLHVEGHGFEGGEFEADVVSALEATEFSVHGAYAETPAEPSDPPRLGVGRLKCGGAVAIDLTIRPHIAAPALSSDSSEAIRHSLIFQAPRCCPPCPILVVHVPHPALHAVTPICRQ